MVFWYSEIYCGGWKINSLGHMTLLKTQIFEKKHSFQEMKIFRLFFLTLSNTKSVSEQNTRAYNFFKKIGAIYMIIFSRPKRSRTKYFKFRAIVPKKKDFGPFFLLFPTMTDVEYSFVRLHKVFRLCWCKI